MWVSGFSMRMDQNKEIFVPSMNDPQFQKLVTAWFASEASPETAGTAGMVGEVRKSARKVEWGWVRWQPYGKKFVSTPLGFWTVEHLTNSLGQGTR
ncbi:MAG: hypothetical protein C4576_02015 [Desulfobacteraceae bacterium]|nr:MAG: hypothetical protein C4576_02015 [Desulfobacteraceae bacterium]